MFGNSTPFWDGTPAQNGFQVLFELDLLHGDGDGYIEPEDEIYADLRLWHDRNGNGRSEWGELSPLSSHGITAIDSRYWPSFDRDEHGNELGELSEEISTETRLMIESRIGPGGCCRSRGRQIDSPTGRLAIFCRTSKPILYSRFVYIRN